MSEAVLVAIISCVGVVVSAVAAALAAVAIKRIETTNQAVGAVGTDVVKAKNQAAAANDAAVAARDYSKPMGNGYAEESREAWRRIEQQGQRTNDLIIRHLEDHTQAGLGAFPRRLPAEDDDDYPDGA